MNASSRRAPTVGVLPASACPSLRIEVEPVERWTTRIGDLRVEDGAVFADLFAGPATTGGTALTLLLSLQSGGWLALRDHVQSEVGFPSLREALPAAGWYEREVFERYGLAARGNPHLQPLGYSSGAAGGADLFDGQPLGAAPPGVVDYPLGPVRSGIVESGHYTIRTVGEEIVDLRLQLAYKHRGIEELAITVEPAFVPLLAERISGTDAVAHGLAASQALEQLAGRAVPPRATAIRTVAAEIERLHNHAGFQADLCAATGLSVGQAQFEIVRERLLRLAARIAGHRYLFGLVLPGGVASDLDDAACADIVDTVSGARAATVELGRLIRTSGSHMDRLLATGQVMASDAVSLALTGPVGRAAGVDIDARRDHSYEAYGRLAVPVPIREAGDAAARMEVRLDESLASADLILELVGRLPDGPAVVADPLAPTVLRPDSIGLGWAEGSRGTELHWLETDASGRLSRYRVRSASFACWQAFAQCVPGTNILTDFPIIEQSFGLSFAGADR